MRIIGGAILVAMLMSVAAISYIPVALAQESGDGITGEIKIGALMPITGDWSGQGTDLRLATEIAADEFNAYLAEKGAGWSIDIVVEDSQTMPTVALDKLLTHSAKGINIVLGPQTSASLQNVLGYANSNDILLFSCCSTSPLLAIEGDMVFRMSPDDTNQGVAVAKVMQDAGAEVVVPVWRQDAWGDGLQDSVRESFTSRGGTVDAGIGYNPEANEFSVEASLLAGIVSGYADELGADKVAVMYIGFGEGLVLMQSAAQHDILNEVRWFGSDGNARDTKLVEDPIGQDFTMNTQYAAVQVASGKNDVSKSLDAALLEELGRVPSTYASSAYDVVWVVGLAMEATQSTDPTVVSEAIPGVAAEHVGAIGPTRLNANGDLAQTNYDVWQVGGDGAWALAGTYFSADDVVMMEGVREQLTGEITVGTILPLTGRLSSHGEENWVATELAVADFNEYLADKGAGWSLRAVIEDSQTSPTVALEKLQTHFAKGINIVLGPETSGNLQNMKGYADSNNILLFSCCSTSPLLAIEGDLVFRMSPDDTNQGVATAKLIQDAGAEVLVPVWRQDAWGEGLQDSVRESLTARGGIVDEGLGYNPEATDFSTETSLLAEIVTGYVEERGADKVAVMYIGFGEGLLFMQSAAQHDILHDVRWFGSDGNARDPKFVEDPIGLDFTVNTQYTAVQVASGKNDISKKVDAALVEELGRVPSTYASSAYDAVWVVGLAMEETQSADPFDVAGAIPGVAEDHIGAIGSTRLNANGDLAQTNYDVWQISDAGEWTLAGVYFSADDMVVLEAGEQLAGEITVGTILPLTGRLSSHGEENWVATELAVADFNEYLADKGAGWSLRAVIEDSQTSPTVALEKLQTHFAKGINIVLGPETSGNLQNMKGYADSNNILLFSCCSTSPLLAIENDLVFRMSPDDTNQGVAAAKLIQDAGAEVLVPVWRQDAWGEGLQESVRESLTARGATVDEGLGYNPEATDFSTETSLLAEIVTGYVEERGADKVAVMYIGFGEGLLFMQSAAQHDVLHDVRWFGSDGNARDPKFIEDPIGLDFTVNTQYTAVQVASGKNDISKKVDAALVEELGRVPSTYASSAYDAVWVVGLAMEETQSADPFDVAGAIPGIAEDHVGAIGSTRLNANGDLAQTNYDVWQISGAGEWTLAGVYFSANDAVVLSTGEQLAGEITVGTILPLTGRLSSHGEENWVATELAVADFNAYLADKGADWSMRAVIEDSQTSPTVALEKLQTHFSKGINIVFGPETSGNLQNMKGYADSNNILLFSCCSTSPLLAIEGDLVFRMSPDDTNQGVAAAKLIQDAGAEVLVPVWRQDAWGEGLQDSVRESLTARGGTVDEGLGYNPEATDFSTETSLLAEIVTGYVEERGADKVAVMYIGFGEGLLFMQSAAQHDILHDVRWFGSDGNARDPKFVEDPIGLDFTANTQYTAVQVASGKNDISKKVDAALIEELGRVPSTYASSAYDAVWVVGLAMEAAQSADPFDVAEAIPGVAENHIGAIGSTRLNANGDLAQTNYDIWQVADAGEWTLAGVYFSADDMVVLEAVDVEPAPEEPEPAPEEPPVTDESGGCLIATAAYGSELAPQVQMLREIRDNALFSTESGTSFMTGFNEVYYSFSPAVANLEMENPAFRDAVRAVITPGVYTLGIMTLADQDSEYSVVLFGILSLMALAAVYVAGPVLAIRAVKGRISRSPDAS